MTAADRFWIYALVDPREPEVYKYIGRATVPKTRHIQHCCEHNGSKKCEWVESLRMAGIMPQMVLLEEVTGEDNAAAAEKTWISRFSKSLTNSPPGPKPEPKPPKLPKYDPPPQKRLAEIQDQHILNVLAICQGCKLQTAKRLGWRPRLSPIQAHRSKGFETPKVSCCETAEGRKR